MARTMIIVWSWRTSGIGEGEWRPAGVSQAADRLLCRDLPASESALTYLREQITDQQAQSNELMIFLHRHHGYNQTHLQELLAAADCEQQNSFKCFLFGEGADAIYLTNNSRGLLGTSGTFEAQVVLGGETRPLSSVANAERKELLTTHFNYVWDSYQLALRRQLFELKEDLLATLLSDSTGEQFEQGDAYNILSQPEHRMLLLRLLSFAGRVRKRSALVQEIRTFEKNSNRTLSFSDYHLHLQNAYGSTAADQFAEVARYILQHLLSARQPLVLLDLRAQFDALLALIPGRTYHS